MEDLKAFKAEDQQEQSALGLELKKFQISPLKLEFVLESIDDLVQFLSENNQQAVSILLNFIKNQKFMFFRLNQFIIKVG